MPKPEGVSSSQVLLQYFLALHTVTKDELAGACRRNVNLCDPNEEVEGSPATLARGIGAA